MPKKLLTLDCGPIPAIKPDRRPAAAKSAVEAFVPSKPSKELRDIRRIITNRSALDTKRHYRKVNIGTQVQLGSMIGAKKGSIVKSLDVESIAKRVMKVEVERNAVCKNKKKSRK